MAPMTLNSYDTEFFAALPSPVPNEEKVSY